MSCVTKYSLFIQIRNTLHDHCSQSIGTGMASLDHGCAAVCRFIVMQHQKAADVHEPLLLSHTLEQVIGTAGLEEQIAHASDQITHFEACVSEHICTAQR